MPACSLRSAIPGLLAYATWCGIRAESRAGTVEASAAIVVAVSIVWYSARILACPAEAARHKSLRSPLGADIGLGSAKDGVHHWWLQVSLHSTGATDHLVTGLDSSLPRWTTSRHLRGWHKADRLLLIVLVLSPYSRSSALSDIPH